MPIFKWILILPLLLLTACTATASAPRQSSPPCRIWIFETYCFNLYYPSNFPERAFQVLRHAPPDEMYVIGDGIHRIYDAASGQPMPTAKEIVQNVCRHGYASGELPDIYYGEVFDQLANGHTELTLFSGGFHRPLHMEPVIKLVKERAKTEPFSISVITRNSVSPDTLDFHRALIVRGSLTILSKDSSTDGNPQPPATPASTHPATQPASHPATQPAQQPIPFL